MLQLGSPRPVDFSVADVFRVIRDVPGKTQSGENRVPSAKALLGIFRVRPARDEYLQNSQVRFRRVIVPYLLRLTGDLFGEFAERGKLVHGQLDIRAAGRRSNG